MYWLICSCFCRLSWAETRMNASFLPGVYSYLTPLIDDCIINFLYNIYLFMQELGWCFAYLLFCVVLLLVSRWIRCCRSPWIARIQLNFLNKTHTFIVVVTEWHITSFFYTINRAWYGSLCKTNSFFLFMILLTPFCVSGKWCISYFTSKNMYEKAIICFPTMIY